MRTTSRQLLLPVLLLLGAVQLAWCDTIEGGASSPTPTTEVPSVAAGAGFSGHFPPKDRSGVLTAVAYSRDVKTQSRLISLLKERHVIWDVTDYPSITARTSRSEPHKVAFHKFKINSDDVSLLTDNTLVKFSHPIQVVYKDPVFGAYPIQAVEHDPAHGGSPDSFFSGGPAGFLDIEKFNVEILRHFGDLSDAQNRRTIDLTDDRRSEISVTVFVGQVVFIKVMAYTSRGNMWSVDRSRTSSIRDLTITAFVPLLRSASFQQPSVYLFTITPKVAKALVLTLTYGLTATTLPLDPKTFSGQGLHEKSVEHRWSHDNPRTVRINVNAIFPVATPYHDKEGDSHHLIRGAKEEFDAIEALLDELDAVAAEAENLRRLVATADAAETFEGAEAMSSTAGGSLDGARQRNRNDEYDNRDRRNRRDRDSDRRGDNRNNNNNNNNSNNRGNNNWEVSTGGERRTVDLTNDRRNHIEITLPVNVPVYVKVLAYTARRNMWEVVSHESAKPSELELSAFTPLYTAVNPRQPTIFRMIVTPRVIAKSLVLSLAYGPSNALTNDPAMSHAWASVATEGRGWGHDVPRRVKVVFNVIRRGGVGLSAEDSSVEAAEQS